MRRQTAKLIYKQSKRNKHEEHTEQTTTTQAYQFMISHKQAFKIATLNCRGMLEQTKREVYITIMEELRIDILCLQETHINTNHKEETDGHLFIFSKGVSDEARAEEEKENKEQQGKIKRKGKGKGKGKRKQRHKYTSEHAGVGFIIAPDLNRQ